MAEWGAIAEKDLELLHYADTPADAFEQLRDHLIAHHLEPQTAQEAGRAGHREDEGIARSELSTGHPMGSRPAWKCAWTRNTRQKLIDQYKDGYRVVAEALAGATDAGARCAPGAGQVVGARDRASPRRQRDDVGDPPAAAARRATARTSPATTRTSSRGALYYDRPIEASLDAFKAARRTTAEILDRMTRGRVAARGDAHRTSAATRSSAGSRSTRRTRTTTPRRFASRATRHETK